MFYSQTHLPSNVSSHNRMVILFSAINVSKAGFTIGYLSLFILQKKPMNYDSHFAET